MTQTSVYLYPWDVDGDPAAAERIAGLGVREVSLAAAYHDVRSVTRFHPQHRIVSRRSGVYHQPDPGRWRGAALAPVPADPGSFERAAAALRAAGLRVSAWVVLAHNDTAARPDMSVRGAFGDEYPWALCIARPAVLSYAAALAAEIAGLDCVDAVEFEACGWYGFGHLSTHDKTGGRPAGDLGWLLDLCFCGACADALTAAGHDQADLRALVRAAADAALSGKPPELPAVAERALADVRTAVAAGFLRAVTGAVRAAAPGKPVLVHADPDPRAAGANPGHPLPVLLGPGGADGVILARHDADLVAAVAAAAPSARVAVTLTPVSAVGGSAAALPGQANAMIRAGATDLRLYHAGLATADELAAIRALTARITPGDR